MTRYEAEIIDAHIAIEDWLGKGKGEIDALLARFRPDFMMIAPTGVRFDFSALSHFFEGQRGNRSGLKIVIDELTILQTWDKGAVLHYRETQTRPDNHVNVRWKTAVLNQ